jgi:glutamate dehydrogenase/leucine dehydrogenase
VNGSLQTLDRPDRTRVISPLNEALEQFDRTAVRLGLESGTTQLLRSPMREHRVRVPVRMDDGTPACSKEFVFNTTTRAGRSRGASGFTRQLMPNMYVHSRC